MWSSFSEEPMDRPASNFFKSKRMRLLLIQPSQILDDGRIYKVKKLLLPRLSLPLLASLTPPEFEVKIIDEFFENVLFDDPADLVGIGFMTSQAPRAYQIGDEFKKFGKKVVMGGIHASALPEEALIHADAVVVGEAEGIWLKVLEDFKKGKMSGIYRSPQFANLQGLPSPRYDLLQEDRYRLLKINYPFQAGRGCPFNCDFCSVTKFFGGTFRWRPINEVIQEIKKTSKKKISFVDDNIFGNQEYARELFQALIPLKIRWGAEASINIAKNEELLRLASESGCAFLVLGIESLSSLNLKSVGKTFFHVNEISDSINKIRKYGINVRTEMIFGFDYDDPGVFARTVDFLVKNKVTYADFFIMVPLPETKLRERLANESRLLSTNWSKYDALHAVFQPKLMTPEELEKGLWKAYRQFFSIPNIIKRIIFSRGVLGNRRALLSNFYYRSLILKKRHPIFGY